MHRLRDARAPRAVTRRGSAPRASAGSVRGGGVRRSRSVVDLGWELPAFQAWLYTTLAVQLLDRPRPSASAVADLSFAGQVAAFERRSR